MRMCGSALRLANDMVLNVNKQDLLSPLKGFEMQKTKITNGVEVFVQ